MTGKRRELKVASVRLAHHRGDDSLKARRWLQVAAAMLALTLVVSCGRTSTDDNARAVAATPLRAWQPLTPTSSASVRLNLGEDCATTGATGCKSLLCVHTKSMPSQGHFCSRPCLTDSDCPERWVCAGSSFDSVAHYCVPPEDWVARTVRARPGSRSIRVLTSRSLTQAEVVEASSDGGAR